MKAHDKLGICHIVSGAPDATVAFAPGPNDIVIAADAGYRYCKQAGVEPDLFVGDFDSLARCELDDSPAERAELPWEKDDTDTLAAVKLGLERGWRDFRIHAALGGDLGHTVANVQTLLYIREAGADGAIVGEHQQVWTVTADDGPRVFRTHTDERVSVFALGGEARGVFERGMHWELEDATLKPSYPIGVSNEALGDECEIEVGSGVLLVVLGP